jgi:hypothetical protein
VRRMIKVLAVVALVAMILVVSISPSLARPSRFGQNLGAEHPSNAEQHDAEEHPACTATKNARNEGGAHHVVNPTGHQDGCWVVLPS